MSIDLSLVRLKQLVRHLPPYTRPTIHIAGTNGKGSVSSYLSSILCASGLTVGRYNSPHLVSVTDCIVINGHPVSQDVYETTRARALQACTENIIELSNFEILTTTASSVFENEQVDVAVIEVGMGGLRDATNIIPDECILVSALTGVDLDHQAFLGSTVEEIAKEKSSIARPGRAFVLGKQRYAEAERVACDTVSECGGILLQAVKVARRNWDEPIDGPAPPVFSLPTSESPTFCPPSSQPISVSLPCFTESLHLLLPLHGEHQLENLATALSIVSALLTHPPSEPSTSYVDFKTRITTESIKQGITNTKWPGRLSFHTLTLAGSSKSTAVLADGAHNPASAATLSSYISHLISLLPPKKPLRITYILALSHSPPKTPLQTLSPLLPPTVPSPQHTEVHVRVAVTEFTPPEGMPWVRAVPASELGATVGALLGKDAEVWMGDGGVQDALEWAAQGGNGEVQELVVIAGSLYLVGDFYRIIGSDSSRSIQ